MPTPREARLGEVVEGVEAQPLVTAIWERRSESTAKRRRTSARVSVTAAKTERDRSKGERGSGEKGGARARRPYPLVERGRGSWSSGDDLEPQLGRYSRRGRRPSFFANRPPAIFLSLLSSPFFFLFFGFISNTAVKDLFEDPKHFENL